MNNSHARVYRTRSSERTSIYTYVCVYIYIYIDVICMMYIHIHFLHFSSLSHFFVNAYNISRCRQITRVVVVVVVVVVVIVVV